MAEPSVSTSVFHDPAGRRWRRVQFGAAALTAALVTLGAALVVSLASRPALPALHLPDQTPTYGRHGPAHPGGRPVRGAVDASPTTFARGTVGDARTAAFYVNWDDNSFTSLKRNVNALDELMPELWHLGAGSSLRDDDLRKSGQLLDFLARAKPGLTLMPLVNNYDPDAQDWASARLAAALKTPQSRGALIANLLAAVRALRARGANVAGVNVDFENVPDGSQGDLVRFVRELSARFHAAKLRVSQDVPMNDPAYRYRDLAAAGDGLVLMGYDEHEDTSASGPVAAQGWLTRTLRARLREVGAAKLTLALGNYGYDWTEGRAGARELSFQDALTVASESEGRVRLDPGSLNPTFDYADDAGKTHHVWYLDAVSAHDQTLGAQHAGLRSFALWRLGTEDPGVWSLFARSARPTPEGARELSTLHAGWDIDYDGRGELLKVTRTPSEGRRTLRLNSSGLIDAERVDAFASPYVIQRWGGAHPKKIALTFDDGPDARFTPAILDVLAREHARATFFVVGLHGQEHPDLLRRIVAEGHEIGNHTFTHPNLALVPPAQFDLELGATERLLESETGVRSLLFRPPFAEDVEPETPDQAALVARASTLGYYTVGMQIDPNDWQRPGAQAIVQRTLAQAKAGAGNVVLLHDAGGDREQTVEALPRLIHALRAGGFELVTVSDLIGVGRAQVMPRVGGPERALARLSALDFTAFGWLGRALGVLFVVGIALSVARLSVICVLALVDHARHREDPPNNALSVSVIVPAYNEEKVVCQTVASLLAQDLAELRVIVVDDGSADATSAVLAQAFGNEERVTLLRVQNGGKARALNHGLAHADSDLVIVLDADTMLSASAARRLRNAFTESDIAAVAGNAKVGNRVNLLTRWQALEYVTAQNLERRAFALLNSISVVPGAIGAWRRAALLELGGFAHDTLAEDADLTLRLLAAGWRVTYEQGAVARTEAPDTVRAFLKQRFRWMFGTLQATWKQRAAARALVRGGGAPGRQLALFTLPNVVVFQIVFPFVSALLDFAMLGTLAWTLLQIHYHPADGAAASGVQALAFYALFLAVDFLGAAVAFALERGEDWRLLPWVLPQRFFYRQLLYVVAIRALFTALRGPRVGWGKLERKATVAAAGD